MKRVIALAIALTLLLCGCSDNSQGRTESNSGEVSVKDSSVEESKLEEPESLDVFAMDTYMVLKAYGKNAKKSLEDSEKEIKRLESIFSVNIEDSDIAKINNNSGNPVTVNASTMTAISKAVEISDMTDGALDITVFPIVKEWGFTTGEYYIPDEYTIDWLLNSVNYKNIIMNGSIVTIPTDYSIDLGSIAKGYTGDAVCQIMRENGIESALLNLGGNVQAIGRKPDGTAWKVGIENPMDTNKTICTLEIDNKAVITSGSYERFFTGDDGKNYWHIIDPQTGYPADNGIISVTVIGENGMECDALSTALFVMGTEKAIEFCKNHKEIDAVLITKDMEIYVTNGLKDTISMTDGFEYKTIK